MAIIQIRVGNVCGVCPSSFKEAAGVICIYDIENWFYLALTHDEALGKCVKVMTFDNGVYGETGVDHALSVEGSSRVFLKAQIDREELTFLCSTDGTEWLQLGPVNDACRPSIAERADSPEHLSASAVRIWHTDPPMRTSLHIQ